MNIVYIISEAVDFLQFAVAAFSFHLWLLVSVAHHVAEVHLVVLAHHGPEAEVVRASKQSLRFRHHCTFNHCALSHVGAVHNRHLLQSPALRVDCKRLAADLLSRVAFNVRVECGHLSRGEGRVLGRGVGEPDMFVVHYLVNAL